ncbi:MAG: MDR family MFS transporter, partial [Acidimicrobiales bacterium]
NGTVTDPEPASGAPLAARVGERLRRPRAVAILYGVVMFMSVMDTQIVNVALASLSRDFRVTDASVQWVVTAYMMSLAVAVPASGWLGDRFGTKRVFLSAAALFTLFSGLCAASVDFSELVAMRVCQGAAAGMMVPVGMAIVYRAYSPADRVHVTRLFTRVMVLAPTVAPMIGGALVTWASWRWIFTINLPIGIAVLLVGPAVLAEHRELRERFDVWGALTSIVGLGLLLFAIGSGPTTGWTSTEVLVTGGAALAVLALFVRVELSRDQPLLDIRLLKDRLFRWSSVANMLAMWAFFGSLVFTALYVQEARGYSAMVSGLTTFPEAVAIWITSGLVARLFGRVGPRRLLVVGFLGLTAATVLLATAGTTTSLWEIRALCFFLGASTAFVMLPSQTTAFERVSSARTGHGSAIFNTFQRASMSIGVAVLSAVLALAGGDVPHARPAVSAFRWTFATNALVALVGLAVSVRVVEKGLDVARRRRALGEVPPPEMGVETAG